MKFCSLWKQCAFYESSVINFNEALINAGSKVSSNYDLMHDQVVCLFTAITYVSVTITILLK